jgi:hypothetical protein
VLVLSIRVGNAGAVYVVHLTREDATFLQPKSFLARAAQGRKRLVFFENDPAKFLVSHGVCAMLRSRGKPNRQANAGTNSGNIVRQLCVCDAQVEGLGRIDSSPQ